MSKYRALFHQSPCSKTFIFATSQIRDGNLITEFFYCAQDEVEHIYQDGRTTTYPQDVLSLIKKDSDRLNPIEYGLQEASEQAKNEVANVFMKKYYRDEEGQASFGTDPRFRFVFDHFNPTEASIATIAMHSPSEESFSFVYQSVNQGLQDFLKTAFDIKKSIRSTKARKN